MPAILHCTSDNRWPWLYLACSSVDHKYNIFCSPSTGHSSDLTIESPKASELRLLPELPEKGLFSASWMAQKAPRALRAETGFLMRPVLPIHALTTNMSFLAS